MGNAVRKDEPEYVPGRPYRTREIAEHEGVSQETVCDWIRQHGLKAKRWPGGYRVLGRDMNEFLERK